MKHWVTLLSIALVAGSASAKPEATRQASMTNGVRSVSKADSGKNTVYGYIMPMTFTKDEIGKMFEFVVDSPKPVVIQMWNGLISKTDTEWEKRRGFMGASGEPSKTPSFKFLAEKGSVTLMVLPLCRRARGRSRFISRTEKKSVHPRNRTRPRFKRPPRRPPWHVNAPRKPSARSSRISLPRPPTANR